MSEFRERLLGDERRSRRVACGDVTLPVSVHSKPATDRRDRQPPPSTAASLPGTDHSLAARHLADTIDQSVQRNLWEQANRLASLAARLAPSSLRLTECLTRLHLAQGHVESALALVDRAGHPPDSLRLLRTVCFLHCGRAAEAHLELHAWCRQTTAPLAARTLLALLDWEAGDQDTAHDELVGNLRHVEDPQTLALLVIINTARGRRDLAAHWAERLRTIRLGETEGGMLDLLLASLGCAGMADVHEASKAQVMTLAAELIAQEHLLPALVHAQELEPHAPTARLMGRALQQALPDLANQSAALDCIARLWHVAGEHDAAIHWARRAAAASPMSAAAALLVQQVERAAHATTHPPTEQSVLRIAGNDLELDRAAA